ncbi:MAG: hypothetical protein WD334_05475, partial [Chitinophagales bacterium]
MNQNNAILVITAFFLALSACQETSYTPKPKGYFKIDLPEKKYRLFNPSDCPFQFEVPHYSKVVRDTTFFNEATAYPCWMNIDFKSQGGKIHLSYRPVDNRDTLRKLIDDSHKLTFKHSIKADYIDEMQIHNKRNNVSGILYQVGGNAASNIQFYVSDDSAHFIRGALYFPVEPNEDSLA